MEKSIEREADISAELLSEGKLILYPTDTIWGIGCDATNEQAVRKIFDLKGRAANKSMIILLADTKDISLYAEQEPAILDYLSKTTQATTAIYKNGKNIAGSLLSENGTIAIRITKDEFCTTVINKLGRPLVSSSANISGKPAPATYKDIDERIKKGVDYIVQHRQGDFKVANPSVIIQLNEENKIVVIRP